MADNRRTSFRHAVDLPVELTAKGGEAQVLRLGNLSEGGAFVLAVKLAMSTRVMLRFHIPTQAEVIETEGTVRWSTDEGVGVQFDGLRARDVWSLGKYFEQLPR